MSTGPVETEIKLRVRDASTALDLIARIGATPLSERVFEANMVYDTPAGEIRGRGELLRLRQAGERCVLTWKGPGSAGKHKSREETEVLVSDCGRLDEILRRLGYAPTFRYEKYRTEFSAGAGVITVDETPIGCFVELEGAPPWIDATASAMGFSETDYVTLSYGALYAQHCESAGMPLSWMVFHPGTPGKVPEYQQDSTTMEP